MQLTRAWNFSIAHAAHEDVAFPLRQAVARVERDTRCEGVELTLRQLRAAFDKGRLAEINPAGEKFDPHNHQAISMVPPEAAGGVPANHVVSVLQKGWRIADRVLRPALVTVASA